MKIKDLAVDHDYYTSDSNYYSNDASGHYENWDSFYNEFKDADIDMNLVFRWDIYKKDEEKGYYMQVTIIAQRKGIYMPIHIDSVEDKHVEQIKEFMKPHFEKLVSIWNPLNNL